MKKIFKMFIVVIMMLVVGCQNIKETQKIVIPYSYLKANGISTKKEIEDSINCHTGKVVKKWTAPNDKGEFSMEDWRNSYE